MASPQCLLLILLPFELYSFSKASMHTVSFPLFSDKVLTKKIYILILLGIDEYL